MFDAYSGNFEPKGSPFNEDALIVLTVDEYEAIRIIEYQGFTQEESSEYMMVVESMNAEKIRFWRTH